MTREILGIPFKNFKEKKSIVRNLETKGYKVQILDKIVYAEKRGENLGER